MQWPSETMFVRAHKTHKWNQAYIGILAAAAAAAAVKKTMIAAVFGVSLLARVTLCLPFCAAVWVNGKRVFVNRYSSLGRRWKSESLDITGQMGKMHDSYALFNRFFAPCRHRCSSFAIFIYSLLGIYLTIVFFALFRRTQFVFQAVCVCVLGKHDNQPFCLLSAFMFVCL